MNAPNQGAIRNPVRPSSPKKPLLIVSLAVAMFVGLVAEKVFEYALQPAKPKDCDFVYPHSADQTKPTTLQIGSPEHSLPFKQLGGVINDASCLNKTAIFGIVKVTSVEDIASALRFARENHLKVTAAGQRHSMGGQTFVKDGLVLDMGAFNQMKLDKEHRILNVQTGATWMQIQQMLDREGLAVKAMQSINIFSVGGTLSVNAHGIAHNPGQIAPTVRSFRIMLSSGEIKTASPTENSELFKLALGGYGLFGVILDVDLDVVTNEMYRWKTQYMSYKNFPEYYEKNIKNSDKIGLMYGRLSVSPASYLAETSVHTYERTRFDGEIPPLRPARHVWLDRLVINLSKTGGFGRWVRWTMEKYAEPMLHPCLSRNQAMSQKEACLVSRNQEMYDSMDYLSNRLKDTDILQEYFIPPEKMADFVDGLRRVIKINGANLLNVTIRIVHKDGVTAIPYAKEDRFAFVLYFNQKFNEADSRILQKTTTDLIDLATKLDGTFYLPYQLFYSQEQLRKAYPEIDTFFAKKQRFDPIGLFTNKFYEKYGN